MDKKWRQFERLVAAIHHTGEQGAEVKWHDIIDGREFDVTIRFRHHAYNFLTVIECRDYATRVPVGDVEAFVIKSRDIHANKAVMVAANGFQSGAHVVAKRHNVELFTLKEEEELPEWFIVKALTPAISIVDVRLIDEDDKTIATLPNDANVLAYYMGHSIVRAPTFTKSLDAFVDEHRNEFEPGTTAEPHERALRFPENTTVELPFSDPTPAAAVAFTTQLVTAQIIDTHGFDPNILSPQYRFTNVLTDESTTFGGAQVKLGFDTTLQPDRFYTDPSTGFNYYIEKIEQDLATIDLLESYQHGQFIQATFTQKLVHARYFVEITDDTEIARLKNIQARTGGGKRSQNPAPTTRPRVGRNDPCPCGSGVKFKRCHGR